MTKIITHAVGNTELKELKVNNLHFGWELSSKDGYLIEPYEVEATEGEHDYKVCSDCQKNLTLYISIFQNYISGTKERAAFPNCCEHHSHLRNIGAFKIESFKDTPVMSAQKIIFTEQHIINNYKIEHWFKFITDYIELTVSSFGQMPNRCGEPLFLSYYLQQIRSYLQKNKNIPKHKKEKLIEFVDSFKNSKEVIQTDFNIIKKTYEDWFNIFPFELNDYFGNLKSFYQNKLPIFNGEPEVNLFSGIAKGTLHSKNSLVEALLNLTNTLLTQINSVQLLENGLITNANKILLDLIIQERKLKLSKGYFSESKDENQKFRKILKEWFADEKKFIKEVTPLISSESDLDFINGTIMVKFPAYGYPEHFEVEKNGFKRIYPIEKYYQLHLIRLTNRIDDAILKSKKLEVIETAIFKYKQELYNEDNPKIVGFINKNLEQIISIKDYINSCYSDANNSGIAGSITKMDEENENDFTLSTIEDWLIEFKNLMSDSDYHTLVSSLVRYFEDGEFPTLSKPIQINGRPNKKWFGWSLNRIFDAQGKGVEKELLQFAIKNISLFATYEIDENDYLKSNLYKYFTTKPTVNQLTTKTTKTTF
jgi:hypothetical protein